MRRLKEKNLSGCLRHNIICLLTSICLAGFQKLKYIFALLNIVQTWALLFYFCPFHNAVTNVEHSLTIDVKSIHIVLGVQTRDRWIVGADKSTELGQPRSNYNKYDDKEIWWYKTNKYFIHRDTWTRMSIELSN